MKTKKPSRAADKLRPVVRPRYATTKAYAVRIGSHPQNIPYLMVDRTDNGVPALFSSDHAARAAMPHGWSTVVEVVIRELPNAEPEPRRACEP